MQGNRLRNRFLACAAGIVVIVLVAFGLEANWGSIFGSIFGVGSTYGNTGDPATDLAITPSTPIPAQARCVGNEFNLNSLPNSKLKWADSVSTPYTSSVPSKELAQQMYENCHNPTVLAQDIQGQSATPIPSDNNATIGSINPWQAQFISEIPAGMGDGVHAIGFLTADSAHVTAYFQQVAELDNTLLLRFHNSGNANVNSLVNYHVAAREGLAVGKKLPIATPESVQEVDREADVLTYTDKTGCSELQIAFNVGDKRYEELAPPKCAPSTHTTPPKPPHTTPPNKCTQPGEHVNSQGHCSKGSNNAIVPGTPKDNGDALQTGTSAGSGSSGTIDTSGKTGSNGKTGSEDNGGQASGANTGSTNSNAGSNQSSNNGGTSTGDTGSGNTNTGDGGLPS